MSTSQRRSDDPSSGSELPTGPELIDQAIQGNSLEVFLDRNPFREPYTDQELLSLITKERQERAMFNLKAEKRREKKQGVTDGED